MNLFLLQVLLYSIIVLDYTIQGFSLGVQNCGCRFSGIIAAPLIAAFDYRPLSNRGRTMIYLNDFLKKDYELMLKAGMLSRINFLNGSVSWLFFSAPTGISMNVLTP